MKHSANYSNLQRLIHWLMAVTIVGLFGLGFWMVELTYYSEWYRTAPHVHQSIGFLLLFAWVIRIIVLTVQGKPKALNSHSQLEIHAAHFVHFALYLLLVMLFISGYLISTADGRGIAVFHWFEIPGIGELFPGQADIAGLIHEYSAYTLIALVVLHALGALKHHFIDKDGTLNRMLWQKKSQQQSTQQEN